MTTKIKPLSDQLINEIAAGELIERPSSIVKELVENSVDAGATDIRVAIVGGGKTEIRVVDNGEGMSYEDAIIAPKRFATSKIANFDDLSNIGTLGFRGEALASISAVSRFTLETSTGIEGAKIVYDCGKQLSCNPIETVCGTTITVKSLFLNIPARKKFLKTDTNGSSPCFHNYSRLRLSQSAYRFYSEHRWKRKP